MLYIFYKSMRTELVLTLLSFVVVCFYLDIGIVLQGLRLTARVSCIFFILNMLVIMTSERSVFPVVQLMINKNREEKQTTKY